MDKRRNFGKDSCIPLDKNVKPVGSIREVDLDLRVADLLTDNLLWNKSRIQKVLPEFISQIQCLQQSAKGAEDSYILQPTSLGVYSTKSGYFTASSSCPERSMNNQVEQFNWIKDIWAGKFLPKNASFPLVYCAKCPLRRSEPAKKRIAFSSFLSEMPRHWNQYTYLLHLPFWD